MADGVLKRDPEIEEAEPGNKTSHRAAGGKDRKRWELENDGVPIPEGVRPRGVTDEQADIDLQHDSQEQFDADQPAGNALLG